MTMRVGYIGLGIMGRSMAHNILKAGFPLVVYNRTPERARGLVEDGAVQAASPCELAAQVDIICSCVTGPHDVEEIVLGPQGLIHGMKPGSVYVDLSTILPETARQVAHRVREAGGEMLDAPVTGGDTGARNGTLTIMAGGSRDAFDRVLPVLEAMGKKIVWVGENGQGQTLKLINNLIGGVNLAAAAEGLVMGVKAGLPLDVLGDVLLSGSARSFSLEAMVDRAGRRFFAPGFKVKDRLKDFRLALEAARSLDVPLPATEVAEQWTSRLMDMGQAEADQASYLLLLEQLTGVQVGPSRK